jgi:opacity protein-like surface antigen
MDLEAFGSVQIWENGILQTPAFRKYKIENLKSNMIMGRLGTGLWDNWDIFVRLGVADSQGDISETLANGTPALDDQYKDFDGSFGFAWGAGTRATFYQEGNTAWGGIIQFTWANPNGSNISSDNDPNFSGDAEIKYWEVQVAIGPTIELDSFRIYGGPFVQFVNGDLDIKGQTTESGIPSNFDDPDIDIHEKSQIGGYAGAQWYLGENSSLYTEVQFTGDAWGVGVGTVWKF